MPLNTELNDRLRNSDTADSAMMEVADYYIHQPGIHSDEMAHLTELIPFINTIPDSLAHEILVRVKLTNGMLPEVRGFVGGCLHQLGFPGKDSEDAINQCRALSIDSIEMAQIYFNLIHALLGRIEELAATWSMPLRELQATLARIGIETAVNLIEKSETQAIKRYAKTSLVYFADIEMLSLGCCTNAYQFSFVDPANIRLELLKDADQIMPIVDVSKDTKLKGALALGLIEVKEVVPSGIPGMDFLNPG